jgi:hypothetical protein
MELIKFSDLILHLGRYRLTPLYQDRLHALNAVETSIHQRLIQRIP